jgi:hypothetical protein
MATALVLRRIRLALNDWPSAFPAVQVHPGLTSWDIFSRPCGTGLGCYLYPGLRPGLLSAVPTGLVSVVISTQDFVLGYSQPSLRDWSRLLSLPRTSSWATLSRPFGTDLGCYLYPGLRPGLLSAVPSGLISVVISNPPRTSSWATLSRPFGTGLGCYLYPGLRPGLLSVVPSGLVCELP